MEIRLGARVDATDGPVGQVARLVLRVDTVRLSHLVVAPDGGGDPLLVPLGRVSAADLDRVSLDADTHTFGGFDGFLEHGFTEVNRPRPVGQSVQAEGYMGGTAYGSYETQRVPTSHERVPEGAVALGPGARVQATDGRVGELHEVRAEAGDGALTHLVLREGHLWGRKDVLVPASAIAGFDEGEVRLALNKHAVHALPVVKDR